MMKADLITEKQLMPGDILLCRMAELSILNYLSSMIDTVKKFATDKKLDWEAAMPLIHWLICYLDKGNHFHAAFWTGRDVVQSRIVSGLAFGTLRDFKDDIVDVYRYQKSDAWLGSSELPVDPLLTKANELVDRKLGYGFDNAYLLAILCVSRWRRGEWVTKFRDLIVRYFGKNLGGLIDDLRPQIDTLLEYLMRKAMDVVRMYRQRPGYVCSQAVAVIYNEAADASHPIGTYTIPKPSHTVLKTTPSLLAALPKLKKNEVLVYEQKVQELRQQLEGLPILRKGALKTTKEEDYDIFHNDLRTDTYYTPRDLAESRCAILMGQLSLTKQHMVQLNDIPGTSVNK